MTPDQSMAADSSDSHVMQKVFSAGIHSQESKSALFYLKSETGMAKEAVAGN